MVLGRYLWVFVRFWILFQKYLFCLLSWPDFFLSLFTSVVSISHPFPHPSSFSFLFFPFPIIYTLHRRSTPIPFLKSCSGSGIWNTTKEGTLYFVYYLMPCFLCMPCCALEGSGRSCGFFLPAPHFCCFGPFARTAKGTSAARIGRARGGNRSLRVRRVARADSGVFCFDRLR